MPTYRLLCSYGFTDGRHGTAFDEHQIKATDDADAIAKAQTASGAPPNMRLTSAVLTSPDNRPIWSRQPAPDPRYPFARDGVDPFEG